MSMTLNNPLDKIVSAIKRKGGIATLTDIKRSISEFNQSGGMEKLRQYIADLVAKGILILQTDKGGKGHTIESYRLKNRNVSNVSNSNGSNTALKITVTLDMALEGLTDFLHSWLNVDDGNRSNNGNGNEDNDSNEDNDESPFDFDDAKVSDDENTDDTPFEFNKKPSQSVQPQQHDRQRPTQQQGQDRPQQPSQSNPPHSNNPNHNRFNRRGRNANRPFWKNKAHHSSEDDRVPF